MSFLRIERKRSALIGCTALSAGLLAWAGHALADDDVPEMVVITGTLFNPDVAPAKASPDTTEPQTIINKSYIEDSVSPAADYVTILAITPSLTGTDINGPGLSEGSVKNTLRGLPDGSYGMTYDGIPFGDTNGPSHHSASYFPASTIGTIEVERGPGNAGNLGAATYGGSINLYSEPLFDETHIKASFSYGSFQTLHENLNVQTGNINTLGHNTRLLINLSETTSEGALTGQNFKQDNILLKTETDLAPRWTLTFFANYNKLHENLNDNNGATPSQTVLYGKNFALQNTNPALPTYVPYNLTDKWTDMDYARIKGNVTDGLTINDTFYTYAYVNKTFTATNVESIIPDLNTGVSKYLGLGTKVNGVSFPNGVAGYIKLNAFRVWGNIFRAAQDYNLGWLTGQIRAGLWWETASTPRARLDFDSTQCLANNGINPFYNPQAAFGTCADSSLSPKNSILTTGHGNPVYNGYAEYIEHTSWEQYEPFLEVDLKPIDSLTITPGVKYVNWVHSTRSDVEPKLRPLQPFSGSFTTTATLPFLGINYKIMPSWSVYAQYAKGIYVPDISAFEQKAMAHTFPAAQTTTNYQLGTVYYADNFTVDADVYYIPVNNNIVFVPCQQVGGPSGDTCATNTGRARYEGIEGEATYAFGDSFMGGMFNGLVVFANGSLNSAKSGGLYLKQAPMWTAATGLVYKHNGIKVSLIDKLVGPQYSDNRQTQFYKIPTYNNMDINVGYDFGSVEISLGIYNVLGSRSILAITENDATPQPWNLSTDQYFFQPVRSLLFTVKAHI